MSAKASEDVEKHPPSEYIDHEEKVDGKTEVSAFVPPTPAEERAVIRKLDYRLIPLVFLLYMLSVLDRSNLGNARLAGLEVCRAVASKDDDRVFADMCTEIDQSWRKSLPIARHRLLHLLHRLAMAADGLETFQTSHLVRFGCAVLGLYR